MLKQQKSTASTTKDSSLVCLQSTESSIPFSHIKD